MTVACYMHNRHPEHTLVEDLIDDRGNHIVRHYYCTGNPTIGPRLVTESVLTSTGIPTIDILPDADHLLHFRPSGDYGPGGEWRLECVHDPDDPKWLAQDHVGPSSVCWTIDWFDNDGYDCVRGEWPEDPLFPLPVDCVWADGDYLEVRPWRAETAQNTAESD